jgi:hypothetical protein
MGATATTRSARNPYNRSVAWTYLCADLIASEAELARGEIVTADKLTEAVASRRHSAS